MRFLAQALIVAAAVYPVLTGAEADARPGRGSEGSIRSCSNYGNGCRVFSVRSGPHGLEYRTPGGNWIECRRDCKEAVREDIIDFWETLRERSGGGRGF